MKWFERSLNNIRAPAKGGPPDPGAHCWRPMPTIKITVFGDHFWCKASASGATSIIRVRPSLKAICGLTSLLKVKLDPPPLTVKEATQYRLLIDRARRPAEVSVLTRIHTCRRQVNAPDQWRRLGWTLSVFAIAICLQYSQYIANRCCSPVRDWVCGTKPSILTYRAIAVRRARCPASPPASLA